MTWSWQHELILELHNLPDAIGFHDFEARQTADPVIQIDFSRPVDHVVEAIERDFHNVVVGIVGDADERQPFRLHLVAQLEGGDLDFRLLGLQELRYGVEKRTSLRLFELAGHDDNLL
jgi:hypothetical protein